MKKLQRGLASIELIYAGWLVIALAGLGGWIANIVKLLGMDFAVATGMMIARIAGIWVPPLGAVLGFF